MQQERGTCQGELPFEMRDVLHMFVDESGDLGFSGQSSRHFVVAVIAVRDPVTIRRIVRRSRFRHRSTEDNLYELKFNTATMRLRRQVLEGLARTETMVSWSGFSKRGLNHLRRIDGDAIMRSLCIDAVGGLIAGVRADDVRIVVDRRQMKMKARASFDEGVRGAVLTKHPGPFPPDVTISHLDSQTSEGLQAADIAAGAIFRSLEMQDFSYRSILEPKIAYWRIR